MAQVQFSHAAEAEVAKVLDYYRIHWLYEPHTFDTWADPATGRVTERFTPDFYLPDHDVYLEITTMDQAYCRIKNRKVRRLRERYPGIRIKVLYARDIRALLEKYGSPGRIPEVMGEAGQLT